MRFACLILAATALSLVGVWGEGSAHAQDGTPNSTSKTAAMLLPGECGLFVWTGYPGEFRFLSTKAGGIVFAKGETPMLLRSLTSGAKDKFGFAKRQSLQDARGLEYELRLVEPLPTAKSVIYRQGTLTLPSVDGWLRIETARGVSTCNPTQTASDILGGEKLNALRRPDWLEKPNFEASRAVAETPPPTVYSSVAMTPVIRVEPRTPPPAILIPAITVSPVTKLEPITEPVSVPPPEPEVLPKPIPALIIEPREVAKPINNPPPLTAYEVQLGAYNEPLRPIQAWDELSAQVSYLSDQTYRVETAIVDPGRTVYRLRMSGFSRLSTASKFCEKLRSDGVDCFAVKAE